MKTSMGCSFICYGDGWDSSEMGGKVGSPLDSHPDISQKYKMGDISKGVVVFSMWDGCFVNKLL
jgi:hypothetical protein